MSFRRGSNSGDLLCSPPMMPAKVGIIGGPSRLDSELRRNGDLECVAKTNARIWEQAMEAFEELQLRCPRLGGEVYFAYCERESGDLPCPRMIMCWQSFFPVERYLRIKLTPEQWDRCFNQLPKSKMESLIELIEAAKQQQKPSS